MDAGQKPLPEKTQLVHVVKPRLSPCVSMIWCFIEDAKTGNPLGLVPCDALTFVAARGIRREVT